MSRRVFFSVKSRTLTRAARLTDRRRAGEFCVGVRGNEWRMEEMSGEWRTVRGAGPVSSGLLPAGGEKRGKTIDSRFQRMSQSGDLRLLTGRL